VPSTSSTRPARKGRFTTGLKTGALRHFFGRPFGHSRFAHTQDMADTAVQLVCDRCQARLRKNAAYCEECGERTRRARRMVRLAIRIEILAVLLVIALILGFAYLYYQQ
jgi:ribosomal protein L40E